MSFVPRTYEAIRDDMLAYVQVQTNLTDFEIGSTIRTIIEAAALEDDEQYFQMVQLLDAFSIQTAQGSDLDERVADYNITRLQPSTSAGQVVFQDLLLIQSDTTFDLLTGAISVLVEDSSSFPTLGFPYTVRVGEGTISVEDAQVTANNTLTNILTLQLPGLVNDHSAGSRVSFVSGAADNSIAASIQVQVPSFSGAAPIKFVTIETGTIINGNFESAVVNAKAVVPGSLGNVGANQITQFSSSPPFNGAGIRNPKKFAGGRDIETDPELRDRARTQIQSLSKGTILAIKQAALGVSDPVTGQRVVTANLLEDFIAEEVILYIDDGTGFVPDTVVLPRSTLLVDPAPNPGAGTIQLVDASAFPQTGFILVSTEDLAQIELLNFTAVDYNTNTLTLASPTVRIHNAADEVVMVDVLENNAEPGTLFLQTQNFPIVRSSQRLWIDVGAGFVPKVEGPDYFIQKGTGEIELTTPLISGATAVSAYTYYTGLVKTVQTVIDGSKTDPVNFPGVRAAGVVVLVETPVIHRITVRLSITAQSGFVEANLVPQVREAVEAYISSLGIGEDVIQAEIIQRAMEVTGMFNVVVVTPASDVVVLQNELPVPFDTSGNSLVTVT